MSILQNIPPLVRRELLFKISVVQLMKLGRITQLAESNGINEYSQSKFWSLYKNSPAGSYLWYEHLIDSNTLADVNILESINNLGDIKDKILFISSREGNNHGVLSALNRDADINYHDNYGKTALTMAANYDHTETVELLLVNGADINHQDYRGWTVLMSAVAHGNITTVKLLLDNSVHINLQDKEGKTALMWAAYNNRTKIVQILLAHGADVNIKNYKNQTALIIANRYRHMRVIHILKKQLSK